MDLEEIIWKFVGWFNLAQNSDKWLAFVNTGMNFCLPYKELNSFSS
jgi:hypothetical protein